MKLTKTTLINLRAALIMVLRMVDAALLEAYGWTPRGSNPPLDVSVYNETSSG